MNGLDLQPDATPVADEPLAPAMPVENYVIGLVMALNDARTKLDLTQTLLRFTPQDRTGIARELNQLQSALTVAVDNFNNWAQLRHCKGSA